MSGVDFKSLLGKKVVWLIVAIMALGLFLRTYDLVNLYKYGHEHDLQSWIVKDIVADKHLRLIGQETSISGVFIGPIYYYYLIPFYLAFGMDPVAGAVAVAVLSVFTLISILVVFSKLFGIRVGVIALFIYSVSEQIVFMDRWAVPTQTTSVWVIWFVFVIFGILKGYKYSLVVLVVLLGFIWHIHVAFIPLLVLVPIACLLTGIKKCSGMVKLDWKVWGLAVAVFLVLMSPFAAFEIRHGFQQVKGLVVASGTGETVLFGPYKAAVIWQNISRAIFEVFSFSNADLKVKFVEEHGVVLVAFFLLLIFMSVKGVLTKAEAILIAGWIVDIFVSHMLSQRPISEYYFNNLVIVTILVLAKLLGYLSVKYLSLVAVALLIFGIYNVYFVVNTKAEIGEYVDKKRVVEYIRDDARSAGFKCVAINYIGDLGAKYGYRYLFWYTGLKVITARDGNVPIYSIVRPYRYSESEIKFRSGDIGVILPGPTGKVIDQKACDLPGRELDPLNGFVGN